MGVTILYSVTDSNYGKILERFRLKREITNRKLIAKKINDGR